MPCRNTLPPLSSPFIPHHHRIPPALPENHSTLPNTTPTSINQSIIMRVECPPPTPPISPTASVVNLVATLGIAPTCPSTCSCPKICELAAPLADIDISTDIGTLQAEPSYLAAAYKICPSADEVLSQTLNPEAQDFTPKASSSNESTSVPILPASIENKASCSRAPENCCKTSEAAPCNAAKLESMSLSLSLLFPGGACS